MNEQQRILIVDDEEGIRDSLSFMLESEGFTHIQTASNGELAVQELERRPYTLVITDLEMPKMNGYALMQAIQQDWPGTIVVAITGYGSTESATECLRRGAFDYITKPFNMDVILAVIRRALDRSRLEAEARIRTEQLAVMAEITKIINSSLQIQEVYGRFTEEVKRLIHFDVMNIAVFDEARAQLRALATSTSSEDNSLAMGMTIPLEGSRLGQVASSGKAFRRQDLSDGPQLRDEASLFQEGIRAIIVIPLEVKRKIVGTFLVGSREPRAYDDSTAQVIKQIGGLVATAANNMLLYEQLQTQLVRLRQTQSQLVRSARLAAVGELADGVAHEINNPLSVILGIVQLLLRQPDTSPQLAEDLEKISASAGRIASITRTFIEFAKPTTVGRPAPVNTEELFESAFLLVQSQLGDLASTVRVKRMFAEDALSVMGNEGQLRRALVAVIRNAFESMVKVPPTSRKEDLELLLAAQSLVENGRGQVELIVQDTGIGISEDHLERIFEPGFTTKIEKGAVRGLGMGLFQAHAIIETHGGSINVESIPGRGTRVVITLPIP